MSMVEFRTPGLVQVGTQGKFPGDVTRRHGALAHGRALGMLGHAVEYLIDSRLFDRREHYVRDDQESIQILRRMSRAVFAECPQAGVVATTNAAGD